MLDSEIVVLMDGSIYLFYRQPKTVPMGVRALSLSLARHQRLQVSLPSPWLDGSGARLCMKALAEGFVCRVCLEALSEVSV